MVLAQVYVLAEKLQDLRTKNAMIVRVFDTMNLRNDKGENTIPYPKAVAHVYEGTPDGSKMRQFLVDAWTAADACTVSQYCAVFPKEFLCDLVVALRLRDKEKKVLQRVMACSVTWRRSK
jgi:hypothetical protein